MVMGNTWLRLQMSCNVLWISMQKIIAKKLENEGRWIFSSLLLILNDLVL